MMSSKGFLTLVDCTQIYRRGDHYERMAKGLIRSIKQYDAALPCAVITDSIDQELHLLADQIIRPQRHFDSIAKQQGERPGDEQANKQNDGQGKPQGVGQVKQQDRPQGDEQDKQDRPQGDKQDKKYIGTIQKLFLDRYSPFDETIFIEPDCLLYVHPDELWRQLRAGGESFAIQRQNNHKFRPGDSNFSIMDTAHYLKLLNLEMIYHTIGGLIYFKRDAAAAKIFAAARELYYRREELGLRRLSNQIEVADETLFATAVELQGRGTQPIKDCLWQEEFRIIRQLGVGKVRVLKDRAVLQRTGATAGEQATLIAHYSATDKFTMLYLRQLYQLQWADKLSRKPRPSTGAAARGRAKLNRNPLPSLLIYLLATLSALPPFILLKKRWLDYKWGLVASRYKQQGLRAAIPGRIKKLFGAKA